ncbi:hypothetical protein Tter_1431 [Thermobaculum terrenum ATCC BAA-798]|uniref:Uncharacterized protein n=1 Tax=Thermobaculum terrenum (strain ATCC BAA-798 / CCMEE 7001 / YNP1) TaxID=525904 RepID=D1CC22_THET1|nr:hypothetical protein [Thermobaculum terrenum]ACZ42337.1 hypothetical protein Tter_1431 [Thermobaculum terrenum ATCC BAA-798]
MTEIKTKAQLISYLRDLQTDSRRHRYIYWNSRRITLGNALKKAEGLSGLETIIQWHDHILVLDPSTLRRLRGYTLGG